MRVTSTAPARGRDSLTPRGSPGRIPCSPRAGRIGRWGRRPRGRSSVGRALQWHCRGQGFDSPRLHRSKFGTMGCRRLGAGPLPPSLGKWSGGFQEARGRLPCLHSGNRSAHKVTGCVARPERIVSRSVRSCGNSSVGRAQPCQGWGRGFESRFPLFPRPPSGLGMTGFSYWERCRTSVAGWSSLVARRAHNPEVVGSNPTPAM